MVMLAEDGFRKANVPSSGPVLKDLLESPFNRFAATPEAKGLIENALAGNYTGKGSFGLNEDGTTGVPEGSDWASDVNEDDLIKLLGGGLGDIKAEKRPDSPPVKPGGPPWPGYPNPMPPGKDWIMASADTGAAPIGAYKGGDEKIAVGPYQPDDQAGRMWENFLKTTGGKTPFNYEINLNDKGLESIGADATITGNKGGQWSAQGSYDFPTNQEVMGPFGGETIDIPGRISVGMKYKDPNDRWTGSINYNKTNMGQPPGAFGANFGAQF